MADECDLRPPAPCALVVHGECGRLLYALPAGVPSNVVPHDTKTGGVYWQLYDGPQHSRQCLDEFRERYSWVRSHCAPSPSEREQLQARSKTV